MEHRPNRGYYAVLEPEKSLDSDNEDEGPQTRDHSRFKRCKSKNKNTYQEKKKQEPRIRSEVQEDSANLTLTGTSSVITHHRIPNKNLSGVKMSHLSTDVFLQPNFDMYQHFSPQLIEEIFEAQFQHPPGIYESIKPVCSFSGHPEAHEQKQSCFGYQNSHNPRNYLRGLLERADLMVDDLACSEFVVDIKPIIKAMARHFVLFAIADLCTNVRSGSIAVNLDGSIRDLTTN